MAYFPRDTNTARSIARQRSKDVIARWYLDSTERLRAVLKAIDAGFCDLTDEHREDILESIDWTDDWNIPDGLKSELKKWREHKKQCPAS